MVFACDYATSSSPHSFSSSVAHLSLVFHLTLCLTISPLCVQQEDGAYGRQPGMVPLVIPVSVPVGQTDPPVSWHNSRTAQRDPFPPQPEHKPSVIVARRRSLRNSLSDIFGQVCTRLQQDQGPTNHHRITSFFQQNSETS